MSGIYIHIPFCKKKCYYCDFFTQTGITDKDIFIRVLQQEIEKEKIFLKNEEVETIYFGGGTPTLLQPFELQIITDTIFSNFNITENPEITLEANPDDIEKKYANELKKTKINRISLGIQSFCDDDLQLMNRRHNSHQVHQAIDFLKDAGFTNLSGDLIYGLPNSTSEKWKKNLDIFFDTGIQHLSAYHLSYEDKTVFSKYLKTEKISTISEEQSIEQFEILCGETRKNGFEQYEISNFALPGFISKHNSAYWMQKNYLGIGPSAHSYNGILRKWNFSNFKRYLEGVTNDNIYYETEILNTTEKYNDYVITTLRTKWGTDLQYIEEKFGKFYSDYFSKNAGKYVFEKMLLLEQKKYFLTEKSQFISDKILEDLILIK